MAKYTSGYTAAEINAEQSDVYGGDAAGNIEAKTDHHHGSKQSYDDTQCYDQFPALGKGNTSGDKTKDQGTDGENVGV